MATATLAPPRSQHKSALEKANVNRFKIAELKPRIRRAEVLVVDLLADPPGYIASMEIGKLLQLQWRWGEIRARKLLNSIPIRFDREVGRLTERQRQVLIEKLPLQTSPNPKSPRSAGSAHQCHGALRKANRTRTQRAKLKRDLKSGSTLINDVLLSPPSYLENAKLTEILKAVPLIGKDRRHKILMRCHISAHRTIGSLTQTERHRLINWVQKLAHTAAS